MIKKTTMRGQKWLKKESALPSLRTKTPKKKCSFLSIFHTPVFVQRARLPQGMKTLFKDWKALRRHGEKKMNTLIHSIPLCTGADSLNKIKSWTYILTLSLKATSIEQWISTQRWLVQQPIPILSYSLLVFLYSSESMRLQEARYCLIKYKFMQGTHTST